MISQPLSNLIALLSCALVYLSEHDLKKNKMYVNEILECAETSAIV